MKMRIGHFSDVHLLSLKGSSWLDFLSKRWIGGLNLLSSRARHHKPEIFDAMIRDINALGIEHLVATGDITNVALESEFAFAREKFDRLEAGPSEVTVIPGNHDAYVEQGREHFEASFGEYFKSDSGWTHEDSWPVVRVRGDLAVIGLSTSLQTPWFTCYGVLGDGQLERLDEVLGDPRLDGKFRLVAIHHPPTGPRAENKTRGMRDFAAFADIIKRRGAELILHGHEHEDIANALPTPEGTVAVRGIQSGTYFASSYDRQARYRIYEIATESGSARPSLVAESLRVWNEKDSQFEADLGAKESPNLAEAANTAI